MTRPLLRELVAYPYDGDEPVGSVEFDDRLIDDLRPLFDIGDDEDMVDVYPVAAARYAEVAAILGTPLRPDREYFIESSAPPAR